ncbi:MAG: NYN domain-containing protein [Patescibacteria group bacterium]
MIKHPYQRVAVLIDVQNLYYSARNLYNAKVNFGNIVEDGVAGRQLTRAIAYVVKTKTGEEKPFFEALGKIGIETKEKELQIFFGGAKKADWDVGLAVDAIVFSEKVDTIVLVTGDGDFQPLVEYLKRKGVYVEVMAFKETASSKIVESSDAFTDLSGNKARYLIGNRTMLAKDEETPKSGNGFNGSSKKFSFSPEDKKNEDERPKRTNSPEARSRRGRPRIPLSSIK